MSHVRWVAKKGGPTSAARSGGSRARLDAGRPARPTVPVQSVNGTPANTARERLDRSAAGGLCANRVFALRARCLWRAGPVLTVGPSGYGGLEPGARPLDMRLGQSFLPEPCELSQEDAAELCEVGGRVFERGEDRRPLRDREREYLRSAAVVLVELAAGYDLPLRCQTGVGGVVDVHRPQASIDRLAEVEACIAAPEGAVACWLCESRSRDVLPAVCAEAFSVVAHNRAGNEGPCGAIIVLCLERRVGRAVRKRHARVGCWLSDREVVRSFESG